MGGLRAGLGFNTQPPEGGCAYDKLIRYCRSVSTHSRPKAAARLGGKWYQNCNSFNTQPPEGGCLTNGVYFQRCCCFNTQPPEGGCQKISTPALTRVVSTHSRPKAAAGNGLKIFLRLKGFNTQPPEGGCSPACSPHPQRLSRLCFAKLPGKAVGRV